MSEMENNYSWGENNNGMKAIFHKFNFNVRRGEGTNLHKTKLFLHSHKWTQRGGELKMDTWCVIKRNDNVISNLLHIKWQFLFGYLSINVEGLKTCVFHKFHGRQLVWLAFSVLVFTVVNFNYCPNFLR